MSPTTECTTAFVLGGGGLHGAAEVGMLKALAETDIRPDLVVGTSIGSVNGAIISSGPLPEMTEHLEHMWLDLVAHRILSESLYGRMSNLVRHRTHMHSNASLRNMLDKWLPVDRFDQLLVPFQCVAACIEESSEHWFAQGSLIEAILASSAVPGLLPPVEVAGRHFVDGGVVNSIPISRALDLGATEIYVMHVGNIDAPLRLPRQAWDVAFVAFEIARRHRFNRDMDSLPGGVTVHVLPTGGHGKERSYDDPAKLRYNDRASIEAGVDRALAATNRQYLARI